MLAVASNTFSLPSCTYCLIQYTYAVHLHGTKKAESEKFRAYPPLCKILFYPPSLLLAVHHAPTLIHFYPSTKSDGNGGGGAAAECTSKATLPRSSPLILSCRLTSLIHPASLSLKRHFSKLEKSFVRSVSPVLHFCQTGKLSFSG